MAEFPDLGEHCEFNDCNILDFLPFQCNDCNRTYCLQHRQPSQHECTGLSLASSGAPTSTNVVRQSSTQCTFQNCQNREVVSIICPFCDQAFCLKHRLQQDHDCIKLDKLDCTPSKTSVLVKSILSSRNETQKHGVQPCKRGATKLSAKVALMKIKMNAIGENSVPPDDRIYFSVTLPNTNIVKNYYFSKTWTIGKLVDYVSSIENMTNLNNVATAKKLKLFRDDMKYYYPMHNTIEELIHTKAIFDGQSAILKYDS